MAPIYQFFSGLILIGSSVSIFKQGIQYGYGPSDVQ